LKTLKNIFQFKNPLQILCNRLFFGSTGPSIYRYKTLQFIVDHDSGDQDGPRSCVVPGLYDPFFDVIEADGPLNIIDMGANAGGFVLALLKNGQTVGRGVSVELNPVTWSRLIYNVYANVPDAYGKMSVLNGAVAPDEGFLEIRLGGGGVGDSVKGSVDGTLYHLPCYTPESLVAGFNSQEIDIIKIDIEGSEYDLLNTPANVLRTSRYILIEIHAIPGRSESEVRNWIENADFQELAPSRRPEEDNVFLFKRRD
jgi:FkbM family methyltransferase